MHISIKPVIGICIKRVTHIVSNVSEIVGDTMPMHYEVIDAESFEKKTNWKNFVKYMFKES